MNGPIGLNVEPKIGGAKVLSSIDMYIDIDTYLRLGYAPVSLLK